MKMNIDPPRFGLGKHAYVLGARPGSGNIGDAICLKLAVAGWTCTADDAAVGDGARPPGGNIPNEEVALEHGYEPNDAGLYQRFEAPSVQDLYQADADALVVTLGLTYKDHFAELSDWQVGRLIRANLVLPLEAARRYVQATKESFADGDVKRIIFIGSYAHTHPFTNGTLYCAAKAGLNMAAKTLAWELTEWGYRIHIINPYHVPGTPMWKQVERGVMESKGWTKEQADAYARKDLKMPSDLKPSEVADVVHLLLSEDSLEWNSGGSIDLYGGSR